MVWPSIAVATVIAILVTVIFFTVKANIRLQQDINMIKTENFGLERNLDTYRDRCLNLEKQLSFQDGMRLARRTDALYTQILKRCADNKERFTVMMNGAKDGDEQ